MNSRASWAIVATGALLMAGYLTAMVLLAKPGGRVVFGDATHHFVQLRSLVYDRDLHFGNEYRRIYQIDQALPDTEWIFTELTPTGHVRNYMPVGPALLWAPLYLLVSALQLAGSWLGLTQPPDGFGRLLQIVPGVTGVIAATAAALVTWRSVRTTTSDSAATIAVFTIWLGSHAIYYSLVSPSYSHAASMLTGAWFFASWLGTRHDMSVRRSAIWGALVGLCALMRWQDAVFLLVPFIEILRWRTAFSRRITALGAAGAAFVAIFSPQMAVWSVLYGQPLAIPQGPSFMQWTNPQLVAVLFSDNHGLLSWAPVLVLALAGLIVGVVRNPTWRLPVIGVLLVSWYVNAAVADWWAGEAYGARRFLSLFPLFTLGLATWLDRPARPTIWYGRVAALVLLTALNGLLLLQYQLYMKGLSTLAAYPHGWFNLYVERFIVPWRLIEWLVR